MNNKKTLKITLSGLFAAFIAICSQIQIPLPYIPINLALLAGDIIKIILATIISIRIRNQMVDINWR